MANVGDPVASGVSTAQQWRTMQQQLRIQQEQHEETLRNTRADTMVKQRQGVLIEKQQEQTDATTAGQRIMNRGTEALQPHTIATAEAEARLRKLAIPGMANTAAFEEMMGKLRPGISSAGSLAKILDQITRMFRR